ncbi:MAG: hypothetical protein AAF789_05420 [Bacteroidota bacterium]
MSANQELYNEEINSLRKFRSKLDTHTIYKEDLDDFSNDYEELIAQAKVITRVSDRLQKKLDNANLQIKDQNDEIKDKNQELEQTISQLVVAQVGKKASTIMFTVGFLLFVLEQIALEPIIEEKISIPYLGYGILALIFLFVKILEGRLEAYFLNKEKKKILEQEKKEESAWS